MQKAAAAVVIILSLSLGGSALGEEIAKSPDGLLEKVSEALAGTGWQIHGATEPLMTRWLYHQYVLAPGNWVAEAEERLMPFHGSLAIGLMAAHENDASPQRAVELLRRAEERALSIKVWTGNDATSLGFLFELIPRLPAGTAALEVVNALNTLKRWQADETRTHGALLSLTRAAEKIDSEQFRPMLLKEAMSSHHNWETIETLAANQAKEKPQETVEQAMAMCATRKNYPNCHSYLKGALMAAYADEMGTAFEKAVSLSDPGRSYVLISIGEALIQSARKKEAGEWLDSIETMKDREEWLTQSLAEMRNKIDQYPIAVSSRTVLSATIDAFLVNPSPEQFRDIMISRKIVFRDAGQALAFAKTADARLASMEEFGWKETRHDARDLSESVTAQAYGLGGNKAEARRLAEGIKSPEYRAQSLLLIYEQQHPLPEIARTWPLTPSSLNEPQIVMEGEAGRE